MHKNEFIRQLARETGLPQKEVGEIVKRSMSLIARVLRDGDKVVLTGFGTFEVRKRRERRGVNPKTKEKIIIPATQTPGFTSSNTLKLAVLGQVPVEKVAAAFDSPDETDDPALDEDDATAELPDGTSRRKKTTRARNPDGSAGTGRRGRRAGSAAPDGSSPSAGRGRRKSARAAEEGGE